MQQACGENKLKLGEKKIGPPVQNMIRNVAGKKWII